MNTNSAVPQSTSLIIPRPRKAYAKTVVALVVICLAVLAVKWAPTSAADPGDDYNDGLQSDVCQMYSAGYSTDRIAVELDKTFGDFETNVGQPVTVGEWGKFAVKARWKKCA